MFFYSWYIRADAVKKVDEESEEMLEKFEEGRVNMETFVEEYKQLRQKFHTWETKRIDVEPKLARYDSVELPEYSEQY